MPVYRLSAEVIIDAPDAAQAADKLRDALCEIGGEVDCVNWCEINYPAPNSPAFWTRLRDIHAEVSDEEVA